MSYSLWPHGLLIFMSIELVMPSNHLILCHPLLLLPSIFPSIQVFPNESVLCIRLQKYWSFSFRINPFNGYSELISFRMDWFDLLAVQGTLKSLLQHHSSKASILPLQSYSFWKFFFPLWIALLYTILLIWGFLPLTRGGGLESGRVEVFKFSMQIVTVSI